MFLTQANKNHRTLGDGCWSCYSAMILPRRVAHEMSVQALRMGEHFLEKGMEPFTVEDHSTLDSLGVARANPFSPWLLL